jgi:hypothetical protein
VESNASAAEVPSSSASATSRIAITNPPPAPRLPEYPSRQQRAHEIAAGDENGDGPARDEEHREPDQENAWTLNATYYLGADGSAARVRNGQVFGIVSSS